MQNNTSKLQKRIKELEATLENKKKEFIDIEKQLATAYAEGADTTVTAKKLSSYRDEMQAICSGLAQLDNTLYETQVREHTELAEKLNAETNKKFNDGIKQIETALKPLIKTLGGLVPQGAVTEVLQKTNEAAKKAIWESLQEEESKIYAKTVPPLPVKPWPRENGVSHEKPTAAFL